MLETDIKLKSLLIVLTNDQILDFGQPQFSQSTKL